MNKLDAGVEVDDTWRASLRRSAYNLVVQALGYCGNGLRRLDSVEDDGVTNNRNLYRICSDASNTPDIISDYVFKDGEEPFNGTLSAYNAYPNDRLYAVKNRTTVKTPSGKTVVKINYIIYAPVKYSDTDYRWEQCSVANIQDIVATEYAKYPINTVSNITGYLDREAEKIIH